MKHMKPCLILALLAASTPALANKADDLFKQGKKLMAEKKFAAACPKLEESYKLDPGIGGELNIARCYEEWGKLGKAYHLYLDALDHAEHAKDARAPKIKDLITKLEPQVPRIVIHLPKGADTKGLQVAIDGTAIALEDLDKPQLVDPGPKQIEYALGSGTPKQKLVPVERGSTAEITLDLPKATVVEARGHGHDGHDASDDHATTHEHPDRPEPDTRAADTTGHGQRLAGLAIAGTGVVAVGVASYLALAARGAYNDALAAHCMNMTNACDAQGLVDTHDARSRANTASIIFGVGAAATIGGIVLYVLAPHAASSSEHAFYVVPTTTPGGGGLAFGGRL